MAYQDFMAALTAWQNAARQVRALKAQLAASEAACATARSDQQTAAGQLPALQQQMQDALQEMLRLLV